MKINNIVCSGDLNQQVPFERLPELPVDTYKYDPTRYHGAYILLTEGKATIYKSGKYIIYGLKSLDSVNQSYEEFLAILSPIVDSAIVTSLNTMVNGSVLITTLPFPQKMRMKFCGQ